MLTMRVLRIEARDMLTRKGFPRTTRGRPFQIERVARIVCDRRVRPLSGYKRYDGWGERFVLISLPRVRFLER